MLTYPTNRLKSHTAIRNHRYPKYPRVVHDNQCPEYFEPPLLFSTVARHKNTGSHYTVRIRCCENIFRFENGISLVFKSLFPPAKLISPWISWTVARLYAYLSLSLHPPFPHLPSLVSAVYSPFTTSYFVHNQNRHWLYRTNLQSNVTIPISYFLFV